MRYYFNFIISTFLGCLKGPVMSPNLQFKIHFTLDQDQSGFVGVTVGDFIVFFYITLNRIGNM